MTIQLHIKGKVVRLTTPELRALKQEIRRVDQELEKLEKARFLAKNLELFQHKKS